MADRAALVAAVQERVPAAVRVREGGADDLAALVAFHNAAARPTQRQSIEQARRFEEGNPQPRRLVLLVERRAPGPEGGDAAAALLAVGQTSDGGVFAQKDGSFRFSVRVAPEWRRRGIGSALLDALEAYARAERAPRHVTSVRGDEPEGLAFTERRGYTPFHHRINAFLDVRAFDASRFDDPDSVAARAGARILSYAAFAEEHAADLEAFQRAVYAVVVETQMDIPTPEPPNPPPYEAIRDIYFAVNTFDHTSSMVAVREDRIVGVTITTKNEDIAYTGYTGVRRETRGQGLALAMKLKALAALRETGATLFGTTNDEANAAMRGINARLGYVADPPITQVEKRLT